MVTEPYYRDDFVTLYHGDCLEHPEWWVDADVLVTDPPYGISYKSGTMSNATTPTQDSIAGDQTLHARDDALQQWGPKPALVFGSWKQPRPDRVRHRLLWYKTAAIPGMRSTPWFSADEEIYVLGAGFVGAPTQNVYQTKTRQDGAHGLVAQTGHPTPKPLDLMESLIMKCPPAWIIADPFAGSGSTLVAAKRLGRKAVGVELEERYCEIAAKRLSQGVLDLWERGR